MNTKGQIVEYKVLEDYDLARINYNVNELIKQGFEIFTPIKTVFTPVSWNEISRMREGGHKYYIIEMAIINHTI